MNEPCLFLMRHGRTDANDAGLVQGCGDLPLNAMGRTEVGTTASALRSAGIQEVWSSPRRRAGESACLVAADLDLEHAVREDGRLDEIDSGSWTGRTWADLRGDPLWPSYLDDPDRFTLPGGESYSDLRRRAASFVSDHDLAHKTILIVSHLDTLRMLIAVMSRIEFRTARDLSWSTGEALEATLPWGIPLRILGGEVR